MSSRDAILQRIRTELSDVTAAEPPPVSEVWPATGATSDAMIERFISELEAVQGEIVRCRSMDDARQKLADLMKESEWQSLGAAERPICHELTADLPAEQVAWAKEGWDPNEMARLSAGLVAAEWLLADTGSSVVVNETAEERLLCYLPPASVVVARVEQLREHMPAAWSEVARATAEADRRGEFVLITGPSRTADIEKILILGVHGPKRLVVLLID
ncbi:MAG: lactate utilization protein [Thermoguttaceae bacterium]